MVVHVFYVCWSSSSIWLRSFPRVLRKNEPKDKAKLYIICVHYGWSECDNLKIIKSLVLSMHDVTKLLTSLIESFTR